MRGSHPANSARSTSGSPGADQDFFHLLVCRNEANVIDELAGAQREGQEVLSRSKPHLPTIHRPVRHSFMRERAAIGDRAMKLRVDSTAT